jgi:AraC family transcriptional regulator of adaptative response/methylated-DNA-[protein]-cysteine methyltransferase
MPYRSDFDVVSDALRFLALNARRQPSLVDVATAVGLSPHHFQRLFTRWAGVSPKRFLRFLTAEEAKVRLQRSEPVLQVAFETGLSGPARLHDLLVTLEGVTPGEFKAGGAGVELRWGIHATPFGPVLLAASDRGLSHLSFMETQTGGTSTERGVATDVLARAWPRANFVEDHGRTATLARAIFRPALAHPSMRTLSLLVKGTNFQLKVWSALLRMPPGTLTTYGRLARAIGQPGAARAVGSAVAANPVAYLIPCHRVIREVGALGQYRWGPERKRAILGWEAAGHTPY